MHIFIKMRQIHPHEIMADFVNKYENLIKPALQKKKNLSNLGGLIIEQDLRYKEMENLTTFPDPKAKAYYRLAINFLGQLTMKTLTQDIFNFSFERIEAQVKELDTILHEDPNYKLNRVKMKNEKIITTNN